MPHWYMEQKLMTSHWRKQYVLKFLPSSNSLVSLSSSEWPLKESRGALKDLSPCLVQQLHNWREISGHCQGTFHLVWGHSLFCKVNNWKLRVIVHTWYSLSQTMESCKQIDLVRCCGWKRKKEKLSIGSATHFHPDAEMDGSVSSLPVSFNLIQYTNCRT